MFDLLDELSHFYDKLLEKIGKKGCVICNCSFYSTELLYMHYYNVHNVTTVVSNNNGVSFLEYDYNWADKNKNAKVLVDE